MSKVILVALALSFGLLGVYSSWILLISSAGHPPDTNLGLWIIPISFLGAGLGTNMALIFAKAVRHSSTAEVLSQVRGLPRKLISVPLALAVFILSVALSLAIVDDLSNKGLLAEPLVSVLHLAGVIGSLAIGVFIYRRLRPNGRGARRVAS